MSNSVYLYCIYFDQVNTALVDILRGFLKKNKKRKKPYKILPPQTFDQ